MTESHLFDSTNIYHILERAEALRALAKKKPLDVLDQRGDWKSGLVSYRDGLLKDLRYRRAITPEYKPWSLATRPLETIWVKAKDGEGNEYQIGMWCTLSCYAYGYGEIYYANLLKNFTQRDGSPCGTEVRA